MQKEVRLTDDEWAMVMIALQRQAMSEAQIALDLQVPSTITPKLEATAQRILTQLRCHEACQTMAPACPEGGKHGTQKC